MESFEVFFEFIEFQKNSKVAALYFSRTTFFEPDIGASPER